MANRRNVPVASIAAVERDTGLSKDTLRVWERRYGFPKPVRDARGGRVYPAEQVERLRVIRRLMDTGVRPNKIVGAPLADLTARLAEADSRGPPSVPDASVLHEALGFLREHDSGGLRQWLSVALLRLGLARFVNDVLAPLNVLVGDAWARGRIAIYAEHLYSEQVQHLLRQAIGDLPAEGQAPRVLLTTLPGEEHQLGLLMAHACLAIEGAHCISLGVRLPAWEIADAARAHRIDIVGLSFSVASQVNTVCAALEDLRLRLDRKVGIWAGGGIWQRVRRALPGVRTVPTLTAIPELLAEWRVASQVAGGSERPGPRRTGARKHKT